MAITLETLEKNFAAILEKTGHDSYVPWEEFTKTSTAVVNAIDGLSKWLAIFREMQHKNFIQTMKKLKSLDIPDSIQSVRKKKLPKQVLKPIIPRFKLQNGNLELVESKETLKDQALKEYKNYKTQNEQLVKELEKYIDYLSVKAVQAGYKENEINIPQIKSVKSQIEFKFNEQALKNVAKNIKVSYLPNSKLIDGNTYSQIVDKSFDCARELYTDLVKSSRIQQRKNMANHKAYYKIINEFLNNSEALIVSTQKKIYQNLGLDISKFEENQQVLLDKGFGQFMMMSQAGLRQKIKKSLPSTKQVTAQQAIQVIKFQIKMIKERSGQIKSILSEMPKGIESAQIVPVLLSLILNDYIYDAFGYQEEDFMKNMNGMQLYNNPELAESFGQMEFQIVKLMQELGIIPQDISNMMMGPQGQEMARMMAEMSGMMGNMGLQQQGQGQMNPMELLQAQQAQFQQMFNQPPKQKKQPPK